MATTFERLNISLPRDVRRALDRLALVAGSRSAAIVALVRGDRDKQIELAKERRGIAEARERAREHDRAAVEAREHGKTTRAEHRRQTMRAVLATRRLIVEREIYRDIQRGRGEPVAEESEAPPVSTEAKQ